MTYQEFRKAWSEHVELFLMGAITHEELEEFGSLDNFMKLTKEERDDISTTVQSDAGACPEDCCQ